MAKMKKGSGTKIKNAKKEKRVKQVTTDRIPAQAQAELDDIIPISNNQEYNYVRDEYVTPEYDIIANKNITKQTRPHMQDLNEMNKPNKVTDAYVKEFTANLIESTQNPRSQTQAEDSYLNNFNDTLEEGGSISAVESQLKQDTNTVTPAIEYTTAQTKFDIDKSNIVQISQPPLYKRTAFIKTFIIFIVIFSLAFAGYFIYRFTKNVATQYNNGIINSALVGSDVQNQAQPLTSQPLQQNQPLEVNVQTSQQSIQPVNEVVNGGQTSQVQQPIQQSLTSQVQQPIQQSLTSQQPAIKHENFVTPPEDQEPIITPTSYTSMSGGSIHVSKPVVNRLRDNKGRFVKKPRVKL